MDMFSYSGRYKIALMFSGIAKALLDNYWVMTSLPLVGQTGSDATSKFFYMVAQVAVHATIGAVVGHGVDCVSQQRVAGASDEKNYGTVSLTGIRAVN